MNRIDYILSCSNLPFDIDSASPESDALWATVPARLKHALNNAELHSDEVDAGDDIAAWIAANWRTALPAMAAACDAWANSPCESNAYSHAAGYHD